MDINWLACDIKEWADKQFPNRTDAAMFLKLYGEIHELIDAGDDCEGEIADLLILLLDYSKRKNVNPSTAVQNKLAINRKRVWKQTAIGTFQHVVDVPVPGGAPALCVPEQSGDGSGDANVGGQALAHDRHHENPNSGGTHGECFAVRIPDSGYFTGCVLLPTCVGDCRFDPRFGRVLDGRCADANQGFLGKIFIRGVSQEGDAGRPAPQPAAPDGPAVKGLRPCGRHPFCTIERDRCDQLACPNWAGEPTGR